jgi:hypothetical protein
VYYTGFLYKRTAYITMTDDDKIAYKSPFTWDSFSGSYFAPRRALFALDWRRAETLVENDIMTAGLLWQADFTGASYHSQYLSARYTIPLGAFEAEAGAQVELMEDAERLHCGMTFLVNGAWLPPSPLQDQLHLGVRWASGKVSDTFTAFTPVSTLVQGRILEAKLSGFMTAEADYRVRFLENLSGTVSAAAFFRNDEETFSDPDLGVNQSPFVGGETNVELLWAVSDISITFGGGVFLPGPAMRKGAPARWQVSLGLLFGF